MISKLYSSPNGKLYFKSEENSNTNKFVLVDPDIDAPGYVF